MFVLSSDHTPYLTAIALVLHYLLVDEKRAFQRSGEYALQKRPSLVLIFEMLIL